jgi:hypothetical protein
VILILAHGSHGRGCGFRVAGRGVLRGGRALEGRGFGGAMARAEGFEEHLEGVEEVSSHGCGVGMCRARLEGGVRRP